MTVQTSWRPQLPLPKEVVDSDNNNSCGMDKNSKKESSNNKKWSFGRFFRRKKDAESESSSEEDRKAGFIPFKPRKKDKKRRGSKIIGAGFDHIVLSPKEELFLPFETIDSNDQNISTNSIDKRARRDRKKTVRLVQCQSSSEDELVSLNSSSISKYRSDESIGSGGIVPGSRKSRTARNERYLKRMSRDENGNSPMLQITQQVGRWKTQPAQNTNYGYKNNQQPLIYGNKSSSLNQMTMNNIHPNNSGVLTYNKNNNNNNNINNNSTNIKRIKNQVSQDKRSISYDNHIHLQNRNKPRDQIKSSPPPPPPRDPQRRLNVSNNELRPISYAFDQSSTPIYAISSRCVSDDKLWGPSTNYQTSEIQRPSSTQSAAIQQKRFITRVPTDQSKNVPKLVPFGNDYKYVAEAVPRSRRPINILNQGQSQKLQTQMPPPPQPTTTPTTTAAATTTSPIAMTSPPPIIRTTKSGLPPQMQAATDFWKRIDQAQSNRRGRESEISQDKSFKPRSVSSSRAGELRYIRNPMFDSIYKNQNPLRNRSTEDIDNVVKGSLFIKPTKNNEKDYIKITSKDGDKKSKSMPNYYQTQKRPTTVQNPITPTSNKYDEYVARRKAINPPSQNIIDMKLTRTPPVPPERKSFRISAAVDIDITQDMKKSTTNLEDAINELEAIYKSLKLGDEDLLDRAERRDIPTPTNFEKYAKLDEFNDDNDDDDEEQTGEPDIVKDDVVYRNLQRANIIHKLGESQPPFGIPIGPIPPPPNTDYLHVTPEKDSKKIRCSSQHYPDLVTDDMAVRSLRKDPPALEKSNLIYPNASMKKKRAARTQSANIYSLIQRDAAKPSGGNLFDYYDLDKSLNKSGSLSDVRKDTDDVPSTLFLIRSIQNEEQKQKQKPISFRHPSEGGAVYNLPTVLSKMATDKTVTGITHKAPVPLPRKSITPEPDHSRSGMEEMLNQIAKEAKESSEKLSRELKELRKETLSKSSSPKSENSTPPKIEKDIRAIDEVSQAAKRYEEILLDAIPPEPIEVEQESVHQILPRKLEKEQKYLDDINKVSQAAKICEKKLQAAVENDPKSQKLNHQDHQPELVEIVITVGNVRQQVNSIKVEEEPNSKVATLLTKLDPSSEKIGELAERCMRQINELGDLKDEIIPPDTKDHQIADGPDYDNLNTDIRVAACKTECDYANIQNDSVIVAGQNSMISTTTKDDEEEDIDKIMKECEQSVLDNNNSSSSTNNRKQSTDEYRTSDEAVGCGTFSSSDCLKSSSETPSRQKSSSITSIHAFSSSDCVKSTSSDFNTLSTDPIKTFSTTSYEVKSTSVTPNISNSPFSTTPSPPLNLTPVGNNGAINYCRNNISPSQYNSSEELAMIFGINQSPVTTTGSTATTTTISTTATGNEMLSIATTVANNNIAATATTTIPIQNTTTTTSITEMVETNESKLCEFYNKSDMQNESKFLSNKTNNKFCSSRHAKLVSLTSSLDTIPELLHDCVESVKINCMNDDDDAAVATTETETDTISTVYNFSNNISILISNEYTKTIETQFDSISSTNDESNPDSGHVSLSDFSMQHQINTTTLELSLLQNCNYDCSNQYPFINQIDIYTTFGGDDDDADDEAAVESVEVLENEVHLIDFNFGSTQECQRYKFSKENEFIQKSTEESQDIENMSLTNSQYKLKVQNIEKNCYPMNNNNNKNGSRKINQSNELRSRHFTPTCSSSSASSVHGKPLMLRDNRQTLIESILIACTFGIASNDIYTFLAIIAAVITIIALLLL